MFINPVMALVGRGGGSFLSLILSVCLVCVSVYKIPRNVAMTFILL